MIRPATCIGITILTVSIASLFHVKYKVQNLKRDLVEINRQLEMERKALHVLKAEWAYLTNSNRIAYLSDKHLSLEAGAPSQLPVADLATYEMEKQRRLSSNIQKSSYRE